MPSLDEQVYADKSAMQLAYSLQEVEDPIDAGQSLMDLRTLNWLEVTQLFSAVNKTVTSVGRAALYGSVTNPPMSLELILARQEGLRELEASTRVREGLKKYLGHVHRGEARLGQLLRGQTDELVRGALRYGPLSQARKSVLAMCEKASAVPRTKSPYLQMLLAEVEDFARSDSYALLKGPLYRTMKGIAREDEIGAFTPRLQFVGTRISVPALALAGGVAAFRYLYPEIIFENLWLAVPLVGVQFLSAYYMGHIKPKADARLFLAPLRARLLADDGLARALTAVGRLDELLSFYIYGESLRRQGVEVCIPEVADRAAHRFIAKGMRNPVLASPAYRPNDVSLGGRLLFITGMEGGGSSAYAKSIGHTQILAQCGCYAVAQSAQIVVADQLSYQVPMVDSLRDEEGQLGLELGLIKHKFLAATPKSLVILDNVARGTTFEEETALMTDILEGFYAKGNNTVVVTHDYELVERFRQEGRGQFLRVAFNGCTPEYKLVPGIAREGHATRVAERVGFAKADIERILREQGYVK